MRELETERLRLRYINEDDAEAIFYGWASDPEVSKYVTWNAHTNINETKYVLDIWIKEYDDPGTYRWGIERKEDKALMGMIDVVEQDNGAPVIGYCSAKKYWGNGYMTEALKAVMEELFSDGINTIKISAVDENIGSNRVIQKCGFCFVDKEKRPLSEMKPDTIVTINNYRFDR
ncbi:MAG: GNAT family N-acetyltransferase [Clostridia bacterium]|nr:GNAT family N-acetyltransferase [Clostridia bacterium]